jgi:alpha-tubulin suppressor-like RCC1 family protein
MNSSNSSGRSPRAQSYALILLVLLSCTSAARSGALVKWGADTTPVPAGDFKSLAGDQFGALALRSDGQVYDLRGERISSPDDSYAKVGYRSAITSDGTVQRMGLGVTPVGHFLMISGRDATYSGLRTDGTVVRWINSDGTGVEQPGPYTAVACGDGVTLAIRPDGSLDGWGTNYWGALNFPPGPFSAISCGDDHVIGLRADGTLMGWGRNDQGQTDVPSGRFTAIASGRFHNLALRADGTLAAWGSNTDGQANAPEGFYTAIAASDHASYAVALPEPSLALILLAPLLWRNRRRRRRHSSKLPAPG